MKLSDFKHAIARFFGKCKREDTMPNIQDYVIWRGDLPLDRVPLCDVDALLLSYLGFMVCYLTSARRGVYRMSITDQGTGLMNRVAYEKYLRKSDQRVIAPAACIYIDANGLHEINNERGHEAGDQLLRAVAERLREQFPRDDLYRIGGDEFVVFPAPAAEAEYEARMRAVSESLAAQGYGISYGIAVCEAANGLRELVREADEKMLGSKRAYYAEHDRGRLR